MKQMDLFRIADGNLSICGVMIGDDYIEQRKKLIKEGLTSENWELTKGTIFTNPQTGVYTRYLRGATITLEGQNIKRIFFQAEFAYYPNDVADSFLGIVKEIEKYGIPIVKPQWQTYDDRITNLYRVHNALSDVEVNEMITGRGTTSISLELTANLLDINEQISEDALGVYKSLSKLARREWQHEDFILEKGTIFF
jgi:hypothetical protein